MRGNLEVVAGEAGEEAVVLVFRALAGLRISSMAQGLTATLHTAVGGENQSREALR